MKTYVEKDTLGNTCLITETSMEYSDGEMERSIKDNGNMIKKKALHITGGKMVMSITDSGKMILSTEKESNKRKANYTEFNMNKTSASEK